MNRFADTSDALGSLLIVNESVENAFCPTGPGGGQDNSCGGESTQLNPGQDALTIPAASKFFAAMEEGETSGSPAVDEIGNVITRDDLHRKLVVKDGKLVAAIGYRLEDGDPIVEHFGSVTKGEGGRLLKGLMDRHAHVVAENVTDEAIGFYEKLGFKWVVGKQQGDMLWSKRTDNRFCATGKGGGVDPTCGAGAGTAPPVEHNEAKRLAKAKIRSAPVPSREAVLAAREELRRARAGEGRAGGENRGGSAESRRKQRENLFNEFGGDKRGYVVCPWTGIKMHWTDDKTLNPKGYPKFERGKIFTKKQGGGYQLPNLIPESFAANRARNDKPVRKENLR